MIDLPLDGIVPAIDQLTDHQRRNFKIGGIEPAGDGLHAAEVLDGLTVNDHAAIVEREIIHATGTIEDRTLRPQLAQPPDQRMKGRQFAKQKSSSFVNCPSATS
jgi:hypothetical protein